MKKILDPCCGGRQFWFDKNNPEVLYQDIRKETVSWNEDNGHPKRKLEINPDVIGDFTNMDFKDNSFNLIVFDPPHFNKLGNNSRTAKMYGKLLPTWEDDIRAGFSECFRVLKPDGTLVFKWNSTQIKVKYILELAEYSPLFGHISGKLAQTHWITFLKSESQRKRGHPWPITKLNITANKRLRPNCVATSYNGKR